MSSYKVTRRTFLKGTAALAVWGGWRQLPSLAEWQAAGTAPRPDRIVPTTCDGCGNRCGILVYLKDGYPWRAVATRRTLRAKASCALAARPWCARYSTRIG